MRVDPADTTMIGLTLDLTSVVESIWVGAKLDFSVKVDDNYPFSSPRVHCSTPMLHQNIDTDGLVGIEPLTSVGRQEFDLSTLLNGIADLMMRPNLKEISNGVAAWQFQVHHSHFLKQVKKQIGDQRQGRGKQVYRR